MDPRWSVLPPLQAAMTVEQMYGLYFATLPATVMYPLGVAPENRIMQNPGRRAERFPDGLLFYADRSRVGADLHKAARRARWDSMDVCLRAVTGLDGTDPAAHTRARRLLRELRILRRLDHPHIASLLGTVQDDHFRAAGTLCVATPYAPSNLQTVIQRCCQARIGLSLAHISMIVAQMLSALAYLDSRRLVHGDARASRWTVADGLTVRLAGFGAAARPAGHAHRAPVLGLHHPPESALGAGVDGPFDVWAVGIVLAQLLDIYLGNYARARALASVPDVPAGHVRAHVEGLVGAVAVAGRPDVASFVALLPEAAGWPCFDPEVPPGHHPLAYPAPGSIAQASDTRMYAHALDLLRGLLEFDPRRRLTARAALDLNALCQTGGRLVRGTWGMEDPRAPSDILGMRTLQQQRIIVVAEGNDNDNDVPDRDRDLYRALCGEAAQLRLVDRTPCLRRRLPAGLPPLARTGVRALRRRHLDLAQDLEPSAIFGYAAGAVWDTLGRAGASAAYRGRPVLVRVLAYDDTRASREAVLREIWAHIGLYPDAHPHLDRFHGLLPTASAHRLLLVTDDHPFTLEDIAGIGADHVRWILRQILDAVACLHHHGLVHGALAPAAVGIEENTYHVRLSVAGVQGSVRAADRALDLRAVRDILDLLLSLLPAAPAAAPARAEARDLRARLGRLDFGADAALDHALFAGTRRTGDEVHGVHLRARAATRMGWAKAELGLAQMTDAQIATSLSRLGTIYRLPFAPHAAKHIDDDNHVYEGDDNPPIFVAKRARVDTV